jgi:hypothetical protein
MVKRLQNQLRSGRASQGGIGEQLKEEINMKVVAFNGSARKDGNTAILINYALKELQQEGIDT